MVPLSRGTVASVWPATRLPKQVPECWDIRTGSRQPRCPDALRRLLTAPSKVGRSTDRWRSFMRISTPGLGSTISPPGPSTAIGSPALAYVTTVQTPLGSCLGPSRKLETI